MVPETAGTLTFPLPPELETAVRQIITEELGLQARLGALLDGWKIGAGFRASGWFAHACVDEHVLKLTPMPGAEPAPPSLPDVFGKAWPTEGQP